MLWIGLKLLAVTGAILIGSLVPILTTVLYFRLRAHVRPYQLPIRPLSDP
jgi:hypothetical protein